ncbi:hypothetical protein SBF1_800086 [Candidatus Desulfosporosinus infrequens]|uniref:Uncharacterized protein n=1 Tax=Candidatus Desulfosporosinus infrequens TaxID=2043169 RepID=A0A2U3LT05_9FIRM|nr:hypothetical protein SBF1_800086 [Candidatus Desulfosporosinus infrequens]
MNSWEVEKPLTVRGKKLTKTGFTENFCYSQKDDKLQNKPCDVTDGKGDFRSLRDTITQQG